MEYINIMKYSDLLNIINKEDAVLVYFSHEKCNVCKILKPKIAEVISDNFPKMKLFYSNTVTTPETAGQMNVFSVPTIICFFGGNETIRRSRMIGIDELREQIQRPYKLFFENNI